ncbi:cytochrome P450 [Roseateles sp. DAIF2]|uniref:cytochrome P450 n=1 Tax=Roseateles sp. DAIF2 TaxID=2714952 RepID=UPI0018A315E7|nr:cytochrome P450 [Roseateles sp. DAIF2]QPF71740.1 cytochrome P450 [Roseateles sp. DAIF2]
MELSSPSAAAGRSYRDLPGPRGIPLLGNALQIESARFHQQLEHWAAIHGPLYRLQLGDRRAVVVGEHQAVAAILRDRPEGYRRTTKLEAVWREMGLPVGVFGAHGEAWARQRRMVMAGFDPGHVREYFPAMQRVAARLAARWRLAARVERSIDLQADLMRYTVDTIAGLAFGTEVNTLAPEAGEEVIQRHLDKIFPALLARVLAPLPLWRWWPSRADRELAGSIEAVNTAVASFIARSRARLMAEPSRRARPTHLLEAMLVAADQPDSGVDDDQVAGNVLTMLLAGEDTTANTLAWLIYLLWRHPVALARVQAELLDGAPQAEQTGQEQLAGLAYLDACIQETMRLKPVAPILALQALQERRIGDLHIEAGTVVLCLLRHDSVDEAQVPRPQAFEPERWLDGTSAAALRHLAMPFGAGPRICPGRYLAILEIKLAMAMLLGRFEILAVDTPEGGEAAERLVFTMAPTSLGMRLRER